MSPFIPQNQAEQSELATIMRLFLTRQITHEEKQARFDALVAARVVDEEHEDYNVQNAG
jgi:hypothetical protein